MLSDYIREHHESMLHSWQTLMQINSVSVISNAGPSSTDGPLLALQEILRLASSCGLCVKNQGDYGYAEWGEGPERIDVITHVDVADTTGEWNTDPNGGLIENGRMIGRGALDAKGPALAALFALCGLCEEGITLNRKVRVVFLTDLESKGTSAFHYVGDCGPPYSGFSTDGTFHPSSTRGVGVIKLWYKARSDSMLPSVIHLSSGRGSANATPSDAIAVIECHSETAATELELRFTREARQKQLPASTLRHGTKLQLDIRGLPSPHNREAHAQSALAGLISLLALPNLAHAMMWRFLSSQIGYPAATDNNTSKGTQMIPFLAEMDGDTYAFLFHIRYSIDTTLQDVRDSLSESLSPGWSSELLWSCTVPSDSRWASSLFDSLDDESGKSAVRRGEWIHYTPRVPNTVPFGPLFDGDDQTSHQCNESWALDSFYRCIEVYASGLVTLANSE